MPLRMLRSSQEMFRLKRNSLQRTFRVEKLTKMMGLGKRTDKWINLTRIKWRMKV